MDLGGELSVLTSVKRILIIGSGIVGNLNATPPLAGVFKQVDVRPFVKAMMARLHACRRIKVVDISKAVMYNGV